MTLHKYFYGNLNPVNFIDPSGLSFTASEQALAFSIETRLAVTAYVIVTKSYHPDAFLDLYIPYFGSTDSDKARDILQEGAITAPKVKKSEKSKGYEKPGDFDTANEEFDKVLEELGVDQSTVKDQGSGTRSAKLSDGSTISVRNNSNEGSPTIQIDPVDSKKHIKFRYK